MHPRMREEIKNYLKSLRFRKLRVRTIFKKLRRLDKFFGLGDIILLNTVVTCLIELDLPYSKGEIYSAFKEVDKLEYELGDKHKLLQHLLRAAEENTVFR